MSELGIISAPVQPIEKCNYRIIAESVEKNWTEKTGGQSNPTIKWIKGSPGNAPVLFVNMYVRFKGLCICRDCYSGFDLAPGTGAGAKGLKYLDNKFMPIKYTLCRNAEGDCPCVPQPYYQIKEIRTTFSLAELEGAPAPNLSKATNCYDKITWKGWEKYLECMLHKDLGTQAAFEMAAEIEKRLGSFLEAYVNLLPWANNVICSEN